jgi:hypothetical protein
MSSAFRFYAVKAGGHVHVNLWAGKAGSSLGKCGKLVFRDEEWTDFVKVLQGRKSSLIEIILGDEGERVPPQEHTT